MRRLALGVLAAMCVLVHVRVLAICPNMCSGHGECGPTNVCSCHPSWSGGAPDCSFRSCASGVAWSDTPYATDTAHRPAECSNRGLCDRSTGICKCFAGFTGLACQRSTCPGDCSGHGQCSSIRDVSLYRGPDYDGSSTDYGDGFGVDYTNWEKDSAHLCECVDGYFGPDCSQVMCPKDDDPLTINQNYRALSFVVTSTKQLLGTLGLQFQGTVVYIPMVNFTNNDCASAIAFKGKFGDVACTSTYMNYRQRSFALTFKSWPMIPKDSNLYAHFGNPSKAEFLCNTAFLTRLSVCEFTDVAADNIREYVYCSNRGKCDFTTGLCSCLSGFAGPACSNVTETYSSGTTSLPGLAVNVNNASFTSTVLTLSSAKSKAPDFAFIEATAGSQGVFSVRGDGAASMDKLLSLTGGYTISSGGLFVSSGGVTISTGKMSVASALDSAEPLVQISSTRQGQLSAGYALLFFNATTPYASNNLLLQGLERGKHETFRVRADGWMWARGGLWTGGAVSVNAVGLQVTGGATVHSQGLRVDALGLDVVGGLSVGGRGVAVFSSGLKVKQGLTVLSSGFKAVAGLSVQSLGLVATGGATINTLGMYSAQQMQVQSTGVVATGGFSVATGGLLASSGGLTVSKNGMLVSGAALLQSVGARVTGGTTIWAFGLGVTGGLTVFSGGMTMVGATLVQSAMSSGDSLAVNAGLIVNGAMTVLSEGAHISDGLTVSGNLMVDSGLTVGTGVEVGNSGFTVAGGLNVIGDVLASQGTSAGALLVDGVSATTELRTFGENNLESSPVIFSDRRLKTNLAPITGALDKVTRLKGLYFDWVSDEVSGMKMDRRRQVGVLAQDVRRVLPEVVRDDHGQYLSVDYSALVPLLIEAIRDLQQEAQAKGQARASLRRARLRGLQGEAATYRARLDEMRALLAALEESQAASAA